jgi:hypothetical protein
MASRVPAAAYIAGMSTNTSIGSADGGGNENHGNADGLGNKTLGDHATQQPPAGSGLADDAGAEMPDCEELEVPPGRLPKDR